MDHIKDDFAQVHSFVHGTDTILRVNNQNKTVAGINFKQLTTNGLNLCILSKFYGWFLFGWAPQHNISGNVVHC